MKRNLMDYPLRRVSNEGLNEDGFWTVTLECGHELGASYDSYGQTFPTKRRCWKCPKKLSSRAGYVVSGQNVLNGGYVTIYLAREAGLDDSDGQYVTVCEAHGTLCNTTSLSLAKPFLKIPEFCEECMKGGK